MSFLSYLCPVKRFNWLFSNKCANSFATYAGYSILAGSLAGYAFCHHEGHGELLKPLVISTVVGASTILLSLENARLLEEQRMDAEVEGREPPAPERHLTDEDIAASISYLANHYYSFYNNRMGLELAVAELAGAVGGAVGGADAEVVGVVQQIFRQPNIPLEFALAFAYSLLNVLKLRTQARANKICALPDREHFVNWVFDAANEQVDNLDKGFYAEVKQLVQDFRGEQDEFNRNADRREVRRERVLMYCRVQNLLNRYYQRFKDVLDNHRDGENRFQSLPMMSPAMHAESVNQPEVELAPPRINLRIQTPSPPLSPPADQNDAELPLDLEQPVLYEPIPFRPQELLEEEPPIPDPRINDVLQEVIPYVEDDEGLESEPSDAEDALAAE